MYFHLQKCTKKCKKLCIQKKPCIFRHKNVFKMENYVSKKMYFPLQKM